MRSQQEQEMLNVPQTPPTTGLVPARRAGSHRRDLARPSRVRGLRMRNPWGQPFGTLLLPIAPAALIFPQC